LKDIGDKLVSKGNLLKSARTVFPIGVFMPRFSLTKASPTLIADIKSLSLLRPSHMTTICPGDTFVNLTAPKSISPRDTPLNLRSMDEW